MNIKIDLVISASPELLNALHSLVSGRPVETTAQAPVITLPESNGEVKKTRAKKAAEIATEVTELGRDLLSDVQAITGDKTIARQPTSVVFGTEIATNEQIKTDLTVDFLLSEAVPRSKAGHKDKIKAKVAELGYESLVDMQPVHFNEFYAFLQTIPKPA